MDFFSSLDARVFQLEIREEIHSCGSPKIVV